MSRFADRYEGRRLSPRPGGRRQDRPAHQRWVSCNFEFEPFQGPEPSSYKAHQAAAWVRALGAGPRLRNKSVCGCFGRRRFHPQQPSAAPTDAHIAARFQLDLLDRTASPGMPNPYVVQPVDAARPGRKYPERLLASFHFAAAVAASSRSRDQLGGHCAVVGGLADNLIARNHLPTAAVDSRAANLDRVPVAGRSPIVVPAIGRAFSPRTLRSLKRAHANAWRWEFAGL